MPEAGILRVPESVQATIVTRPSGDAERAHVAIRASHVLRRTGNNVSIAIMGLVLPFDWFHRAGIDGR